LAKKLRVLIMLLVLAFRITKFILPLEQLARYSSAIEPGYVGNNRALDIYWSKNKTPAFPERTRWVPSRVSFYLLNLVHLDLRTADQLSEGFEDLARKDLACLTNSGVGGPEAEIRGFGNSAVMSLCYKACMVIASLVAKIMFLDRTIYRDNLFTLRVLANQFVGILSRFESLFASIEPQRASGMVVLAVQSGTHEYTAGHPCS
jgi:hypothetical protein